MFEWQTHSQKTTGVPHYQDLLKFLDLRAQATESHVSDRNQKRSNSSEAHGRKMPGFISAHISGVESRSRNQCPVCDGEKHPLYACSKFRCHMPRNCLP